MNAKYNKFIRLILPVLSVVLFCLFLSLPASDAAKNSFPKKKILLIHSYHAEYPWVEAINKGLKKALRGKNIDLEIFYMDTKRYTGDDFKIEAGRMARNRIEEWGPDVVITADDNAQIFVAQQYINKQPYFVFCGVNGEPYYYGFPASNITGVIERPDFIGALEYLQKIDNKIRKIAVLSDSCSTSEGSLGYMRSLKPPLRSLGYHMISDFDTWKKRIRQYNIDADAICIYMYHTIKDKSEQSMDPKEVMAWTIDNCDIPTVGMFDFSVEDGMLCGVVESGQEHGFEAGRMALALIEGADISSLPIKRAEKSSKMINLNTAKKLGIEIPKDVINQADVVVR